MAKKLVKIIAVGVLIIMSLGLFTACANDYEYKETDFKLTISIDKEDASVGDTIEVSEI